MTSKLCSIDGCNDKVAGRGFCSKHYQRWVHHGDPLVMKRRTKQAEICEKTDCNSPGYMRGLCLSHYRKLQLSERDPCTVEGCNTPWSVKGLCNKHWHRWIRTGSTDDPKPVIRSCSVDGCNTQVDALELCRKHYNNWRKHGTHEAPPKPEKVWLPCIQDNCTEFASRKNGMCNYHYRKAIKEQGYHCVIDGCDKFASGGGGFCSTHGGWYGRLYKTYNVTREQYEEMFKSQDGRCAICGNPPKEGGKGLHVDHDHGCCPGGKSCGKCVRGLLCSSCNTAIGLLKDNPELLTAAIDYLKKTKDPCGDYSTN